MGQSKYYIIIMSSEAFKKAAADVRNLKATPSNDDYAKMYSLYKQATCGDCDRDKPSMTSPIERAKYDAWMSRKGMSKEEATAQYIKEAEAAVKQYGTI